MPDVFRCAYCSEVIGAYEPMVVVDHAGVRLTSLAAEAQPSGRGEARYHAACHAVVQARDPSSSSDAD